MCKIRGTGTEGVFPMTSNLSVDSKMDLFMDLKSDDKATRDYAIQALKKNVTSKEVVHFIRKLKPGDWQAKLGACTLLLYLKDEDSVQKLKDLLLDFNQKVRKEAEKALKRLGHDNPISEDEVAELVSCLSYPSWWVRVQAIKSLEALGDPRALEPISKLLLDEDETVQTAAKEALAALK